MSNFVIIGAAGYIAARHIAAISDTENNIVAIVDPSDSVGKIDKYGYDIEYFEHVDHLSMWLHKQPRGSVHYMTVCSPNHLHTEHILVGLRYGMDVICEKPLVINTNDLDLLRKAERTAATRVNVVLQLRLHPAIRALKRRMDGGKHKVTLQYITPRGKWYQKSWKANAEKSGGLAMNIGIHFFDMLIWVFGSVQSWKVTDRDNTRLVGTLELERASVDWFLSLNNEDLPEGIIEPRRCLTIDDERLDFSSGFANLHTQVYEEILNGNGFGIDDAEPSLALVSEMNGSDG